MPHHEVTDEEYFNALPPNGLALAHEQAEEYLKQAQQDDAYPTKDVVVGLFMITALEQSEDDDEDFA